MEPAEVAVTINDAVVVAPAGVGCWFDPEPGEFDDPLLEEIEEPQPESMETAARARLSLSAFRRVRDGRIVTAMIVARACGRG